MSDRSGRGAPRPLGELDAEIRLEASIRRGVQVLNAFRRMDAGLGNAELAERTGLTKPTVSRIAYTLARQGFLKFDARAREYSLGPRAVALGSAALAGLSIRQHALPRMKRLAKGAAFNVCLGVHDRHWMVYTDVCEGDALVGLRAFRGSKVPLLTSAIGRAYLAGLSSSARDEVLKSLRSGGRKLSRLEAQGLDDALQYFADHGFCLSVGDWDPAINGVAAPVRTPDGKVAAINLGGPAYKLPAEDLADKFGPRLARMARELEGIVAEQE